MEILKTPLLARKYIAVSVISKYVGVTMKICNSVKRGQMFCKIDTKCIVQAFLSHTNRSTERKEATKSGIEH